MTAGRLYCIQSWNNASETSGEQIGNRLAQSRGLHFDRLGNANVALYAEENNQKKPTKVPLAHRILPQSRRVRVLTEQLYELEAERKNGLDIHIYSQLRDVLIVKRDRAEVLLQKALSVRPIRSETDEDSAQDSVEYTPSSGSSPQPNDGYASEEYEEIGVVWIDELSADNSLKSFLKFSCKAIRKTVQFSQATRNYIKTLSEV